MCIGVGSKLRVGGLYFTVNVREKFEVMALATPLKRRIQCASARSISTMYNQPYMRKPKFSKRKPAILRPKIA